MIKIGHKTYKVSASKDADKMLGELDRYGDVSYFDQTIRVHTSQSKENLVNTLLHECLHAMMYDYGIEEYNNEQLIHSLTNCLLCFMQDNKELAKKLIEGKIDISFFNNRKA